METNPAAPSAAMFNRMRDLLKGRSQPEPPVSVPAERAAEIPAEKAAPIDLPQRAPIDSTRAGTSTKTVNIDGQRYAMADLPADVQALLNDLQRADQVIHLRRDKVRVLSLGRLELAERLRRGLAHAKEMNAPTEQDQPAPTWSAQVSTG